MTDDATEMPRCFSISIQSLVAWRVALRAFTEPAIWIAPENSRSFSVRVVLPASGCEMMAKVRRRRVSKVNDKTKSKKYQGPSLASLAKSDFGGANEHGFPFLVRHLYQRHARSVLFHLHAASARPVDRVAYLRPLSPHGWAAAFVQGSPLDHAGHFPHLDCLARCCRVRASRSALVACGWLGSGRFARYLWAEQDALRSNEERLVLHAQCSPGHRTLAAVRGAHRLSPGRGVCHRADVAPWHG